MQKMKILFFTICSMNVFTAECMNTTAFKKYVDIKTLKVSSSIAAVAACSYYLYSYTKTFHYINRLPEDSLIRKKCKLCSILSDHWYLCNRLEHLLTDGKFLKPRFQNNHDRIIINLLSNPEQITEDLLENAEKEYLMLLALNIQLSKENLEKQRAQQRALESAKRKI